LNGGRGGRAGGEAALRLQDAGDTELLTFIAGTGIEAGQPLRPCGLDLRAGLNDAQIRGLETKVARDGRRFQVIQGGVAKLLPPERVRRLVGRWRGIAVGRLQRGATIGGRDGFLGGGEIRSDGAAREQCGQETRQDCARIGHHPAPALPEALTCENKKVNGMKANARMAQ